MERFRNPMVAGENPGRASASSGLTGQDAFARLAVHHSHARSARAGDVGSPCARIAGKDEIRRGTLRRRHQHFVSTVPNSRRHHSGRGHCRGVGIGFHGSTSAGIPPTALGALGLVASLACWFAFVAPVNAEWLRVAESDPRSVSDAYMRLRERWEYGHAAAFAAWLCGFWLLLLSVLVETSDDVGHI